MTDDERDALLRCWFEELGPDDWFGGSPALDERLRERFGELYEEERGSTAAAYLNSPPDALAGVILFDQLPRNLFRGHADAFATDHLALAIARAAIDRGLDERLSPTERKFLYMPFMHSEELEDQTRSVALFTELGDEESLDFAVRHRDLIARFGRFPHRNAALGRATRAGEREAVAQGADW